MLRDILPNCLRVKHVLPDHPIVWQADEESLVGKSGTISMQELIDRYSPEFSHGAASLLHPMLVNGHLQTAYAAYKPFKTIDRVNYKRLILRYPDQGEGTVDFAVKSLDPQRDGDYVPPSQSAHELPKNYSYFDPDDPRQFSSDDRPMLIVLHGLTGGSAESYARTLVSRITKHYNFEACVFNARGCCQSTITTPQTYNGGWTNDIRFCVNELRSRFPNRRLYMVGFSLGASVLSNYIGEEAENSQIDCAVALGNPWDLAHSSYYINNTKMGAKFYSPALAQNLVDLSKTHMEVLKTHSKLGKRYETKMTNIHTVEHFDNLFTAPMFGYNTATEYYRNASSCNRLLSIRTPFLAINSLDDPIVGYEAMPEEEIRANPYTLLIETTKGGHVAWFENTKGKRWYTDPLCRFLSAFHREIVVKNLKLVVDAEELPHNNVGPVMTTNLKF
ncbi:hypothetical protein HG536_0A08240 [Torulaspora globosa]|uniref:AB hydrolase-1 domain-containing protein n=1 Tax=Torulaspora globosa TaxID=48254 RepID=A0A7G3ZBX3_9SACH|nr:uncharacterized protein HG536_0A08240 [Torulaspora globosa]QLL31009.1 hypothetical protein HG536_0A08240 [Torulaspora globosa]